jgi:hypothetical protein
MSTDNLKNIFEVDIKKTEDGSDIHILRIENINDNFQKLINTYIVSICDSEDDTPVDIIKEELKGFFNSKDINTTMGAVAEFIVHLYLKTINFNQECLYRNLEENSIKKGFDGYYSFSNEEWIMESKSGSINTNRISHEGKIKEAYNDLKNKLEGKGTNNPWKNALHHAKVVGASNNILKNIKALSRNYVRKTYPDISTLNIIPVSTIFHDSIWEENNLNVNDQNINSFVKTFEYRQIRVICINKKSVATFVKVLTQ